MFWIKVDKAIPAFSCQVVKVKVADSKNCKIEAWYDHDKQQWFSIDGYCLHDYVYAWKHTGKEIDWLERQTRMKKLE